MVKLRSPAKVNLHLEIGPRTMQSRYHPLRSLCVKVNFYDTIWVKIKKKGYTISGLSNNLPPSEDILYKTFQFYQKISGKIFGLDIHIEKRIPICSGLGGGSSNAGILLNFLNDYYDESIPHEFLVKKSVAIGSDVPLFVHRSNCVWIEGIGEKVSSFPSHRLDILLLFPKIAIRTVEAYHYLDNYITIFGKSNKDEMRSTWSQNHKNWNFFNSFSEYLSAEYPLIRETINHFQNRYHRAIWCNLSGSGSTIFIIGTASLISEIQNSKLSPNIIDCTHVTTL